MEAVQSTPSASTFESGATVEDSSSIDVEDISVRITNYINNKLWGETPEQPTQMFGTILGFKMKDNIILTGADQLVKKWNNIVIGVAASWENTHRIFHLFESEKQKMRTAKNYADLGLAYIERLKLSRIDDIVVLIGDEALQFFRVNKAGILRLGGHIAIGNETDVANVVIKKFPADKTYDDVVKIGRAARTTIMKNAIVGKPEICKSVCTRDPPES